MKRPIFLRTALVLLGLAGCDYSAPDNPIDALPKKVAAPASLPQVAGSTEPQPELNQSPEQQAKSNAILESVIRLFRDASLKPGGDNFAIATENLNHYFSQGALPVNYRMSDGARKFLVAAFDEKTVKGLENTTFDVRRDSRHIEDCMLYRDIALRVAGDGDELTRVTRIFEWVTNNIVLVPNNALGLGGTPHVPARPYDAIMRGMAVEDTGAWCERSWIFMALCRQLGIDVGLLTYSPRTLSTAQPREQESWACAAIVDGKAYLFDARLGIAIPGPDGRGVATLEEAMTIPVVLDRLDLPGQVPFTPVRTDLLSSPTKIGIMVDSSIGYLLPRMKLLESRLAGKNRAVLYRDPSLMAEAFTKAIGNRMGGLTMWSLPLSIENALFTPGSQFGQATLNSMRMFDQTLPLIYARIAHLRGELDDAKLKYVDFRRAESLTFMDKKTPVPPIVQSALDQYATYFLALCQLELGNTKEAEFLFETSLKELPEPGPGRPPYLFFRWSAQANLARLKEAKGNFAAATALYNTGDRRVTPTYWGNQLRARDLVWKDPIAEVPDRVVAPSLPPPLLAAPGTQGMLP